MKKEMKFLTFFLIILLLILIFTKFPKEEEEIIVNKTYISFTFDDAYKNQLELAFPIFKKYDFNATEYVIVGKIGKEFEGTEVMDMKDLKKLYEDGWEIGSHTINHPFLTRLNKKDIEYELRESKKILERNGFKVFTFAVPYGKYNNEIKEIAKKYYKGVRTSLWGCNKKVDFYNLKSKWVKNETTFEEIKKWIDDAEEKRCWLIIILHHIEINKTKEYSISKDELEKLIKYVKNKGIEVKNIIEMIKLLKNEKK